MLQFQHHPQLNMRIFLHPNALQVLFLTLNSRSDLSSISSSCQASLASPVFLYNPECNRINCLFHKLRTSNLSKLSSQKLLSLSQDHAFPACLPLIPHTSPTSASQASSNRIRFSLFYHFICKSKLGVSFSFLNRVSSAHKAILSLASCVLVSLFCISALCFVSQS